MESFQTLNIRDHYDSDIAYLLDDFYVPVLDRAIKYDRSTGYFSSAIFQIVETALTGFAERGGKMRLICSPSLNHNDYDAIVNGYLERTISEKLNEDLEEWDESVRSRAPSSIVRGLLRRGSLEMRIAVPDSRDGIYHPKFGIFTSDYGEKIAFTGSLNETARGWSTYGNGEVFETFSSWDERVSERVATYESTFGRHWNNVTRSFRVLKPDRLPEVFEPRPTDLAESEALAVFKNGRKFRKQSPAGNRPTPRDLQEHQILAIENWEKSHHRGIIDFVTGGGKTVTALAIARTWLRDGGFVLILVPSEILVDQWAEEIRREVGRDAGFLVQIGAGVGREQWAPLLRSALEDVERGVSRIAIGTYASAQTETFFTQMDAIKPRTLIIADECHAIGSAMSRQIMSRIRADGRLGLSATPERFGDPEGTELIFDYFGEKIEPHFGIRDAIIAQRLVPYSYSIKTIALTAEEGENFERWTLRLSQLYARLQEGEQVFDQINHAARTRANIIKNADGKIPLAIQILEENISRRTHWLIYCNSIAQIKEIRSQLNSIGIRSMEYHSGLDRKTRTETLNVFEREGGVLTAVHCLDQGVDIPKIDAAIVVASSANPREYIQRRGRILRWTEGKYMADLYDIVTLDSNGDVALSSDVVRSEEIAEYALNRPEALAKVAYLRSISKLASYDVEDEDES